MQQHATDLLMHPDAQELPREQSSVREPPSWYAGVQNAPSQQTSSAPTRSRQLRTARAVEHVDDETQSMSNEGLQTPHIDIDVDELKVIDMDEEVQKFLQILNDAKAVRERDLLALQRTLSTAEFSAQHLPNIPHPVTPPPFSEPSVAVAGQLLAQRIVRDPPTPPREYGDEPPFYDAELPPPLYPEMNTPRPASRPLNRGRFQDQSYASANGRRRVIFDPNLGPVPVAHRSPPQHPPRNHQTRYGGNGHGQTAIDSSLGVPIIPRYFFNDRIRNDPPQLTHQRIYQRDYEREMRKATRRRPEERRAEARERSQPYRYGFDVFSGQYDDADMEMDGYSVGIRARLRHAYRAFRTEMGIFSCHRRQNGWWSV